jgi:hypothetical protein
MKNILTPAFAALTLALAAAGPTQAFNPQPDPPGRWAMMGMVSVQTARLSVLALPVARAAGVTASSRSSHACVVLMTFLDSEGVKLGEDTRVLTPGFAAFVDLKGSLLSLPGRTDRAQFRVEVMVQPTMPGFLPCEGVAATVEIFDDTGRTSLIVVQPQQH